MDRRQSIALGACTVAQSSGVPAPMAFAQGGDAGPFPQGSVDCHVHIFEPDRFRYDPKRSYTPGSATVQDLRQFHEGLGVAKAVLVQPSPYGADNACLLSALAELGRERARGVAVIDPATIQDTELKDLKAAGIVGVRVNLAVRGEDRAAAARDAVAHTIERVADHDLAVQIYADLPLMEALSNAIRKAPVPVVLDHFAGARAPSSETTAELDAVRRLLDSGKVWIKLSAPYRVSDKPGFDEVEPIARTLIETNPDRLVWASDWPHTGGNAERRARTLDEVEPFRAVDDAGARNSVLRWAGNAEICRKIFVDNPTKLFGV